MKKEVIGIALFIIILSTIFVYGFDRMNKINNGEMIQVSESQMR